MKVDLFGDEQPLRVDPSLNHVSASLYADI